MIKKIIIEVIPGRPYRLFVEGPSYYLKPDQHIFSDKKFKGYHGWIEGYGSPPTRHVDALYLTKRVYNFSDKVTCKLIGAVKKKSGCDLIFIDPDRQEKELRDLNSHEIDLMQDLYGSLITSEDYLDAEKAADLIRI